MSLFGLAGAAMSLEAHGKAAAVRQARGPHPQGHAGAPPALQFPEFDQVKGQIETYVTRRAQAEYVAKLRETAKVERMDQAAKTPDKADAKPVDSKMAPAKK